MLSNNTHTVRVATIIFSILITVTLLSLGTTAVAAQPGLNVSADETVAPNGEAEITIIGNNATELSVSEIPNGWTLTEYTTDPTDTLFASPSAGELPADSEEFGTWLVGFNQQQTKASYSLTTKAPTDPGEYTFTAKAENNDGKTVTDTFTVVVDPDDSDLSVDNPSSLEPGETTEITFSGENVVDIAIEEIPAGWTLTNVEAEPADGTILDPSSTELPITSTESSVWSANFDTTESSVSYTLSVEAPETEGTYQFDAIATDTSTDQLTETFEIKVASIPSTVEFEDTVSPGEETEITVGGTDVAELRLTDLPAEWTITEVTADPVIGSIFSPSPSDLPEESMEGDVWIVIFDSQQDIATYTVTVEAPPEVGDYSFTAEVINGETVTEEFTVSVSDDPKIETSHEESVAAGDTTEFTIEGANIGSLGLQDVPQGWTLSNISATPTEDTTFDPAIDTLPTNETTIPWTTTFGSTQSSGTTTFELVAPDTPGTYNLTAYGMKDSSVNKGITIEVHPEEHESGVSQGLFNAVDQDNTGEISRDDIRTMIQAYAQTGSVDSVELTRNDVRDLIRYYATQ